MIRPFARIFVCLVLTSFIINSLFAKPPKSKNREQSWGEFSLEDLKTMVPQSDAGHFLLDVAQIFFAAGDLELMAVMEGIPVNVNAQLVTEASKEAGEQVVAFQRMAIGCWGQGYKLIKIPIGLPKKAIEFQEKGWYQLIGKLHFVKDGSGKYLAKIQVKSMKPTKPPEF